MYETLTTMAEIAEEVGNIQKVEKGVQTTFGFERCADRKQVCKHIELNHSDTPNS